MLIYGAGNKNTSITIECSMVGESNAEKLLRVTCDKTALIKVRVTSSKKLQAN